MARFIERCLYVLPPFANPLEAELLIDTDRTDEGAGWILAHS